ncbi:MAG TPA: cytochrome c maturation protein CcmE [Stellaceae bacterium]|nr:cytochrome c maturation protein CcmE [Stellaceae bacterium]
MSRKQHRLIALTAGMALLAAATALVLTAFSNNLVFFYSPTELRHMAVAPGREVRIGGLVELKSVVRDGSRVAFRVTDGKSDIKVAYRGALPDLFREGQGVVVEGRLQPGGLFAASTVLAKHDERYMPREVVAELKKSGHWQEGADIPDMTAARPLPHPSAP